MAKKTADATDTIEPTATDAPPPATPPVPTKDAARPANLPTRCRMVEYTDEDGDTVAAVVAQVKGNELHLGVFHPLFGYGLKCLDAAADHRDKGGEPRTWNWPARQ
jgi:hypothetical protein